MTQSCVVHASVCGLGAETIHPAGPWHNLPGIEACQRLRLLQSKPRIPIRSEESAVSSIPTSMGRARRVHIQKRTNTILSADCKMTVVSLPGLDRGCNFSFASRVQWISIVAFALCDTRECFASILDNDTWHGCEVAVLLLVLKYMSKREVKSVYIFISSWLVDRSSAVMEAMAKDGR